MEIYNFKNDRKKIELLQNSAKEKIPPYFRTKWGLVGSDAWWEKIESNNLIKLKTGKVRDILIEGHGDFPVLEFFDGKEVYKIPLEKKMDAVKKGKNIEVIYLDRVEVVATNNLNELFILSINIS